MFQVNFYSFSKKNNSTKQPNIIESSFNCDIRNISNILNPQIELKHSNPSNYNYCYIPIFSRYYFISNWTWNQGLWIASCTIDVLATYKTAIGNSNKYVIRSYSKRNQNLIDNSSPITAENVVDSSVIVNLSTMNDGVFCVGVIGNNANGQTIYQLNVSQFQQLLSGLLTTADGYDWGDLARGLKNSIMNPFQYITSCRWYPKAFTSLGSSEELKCGLWGSGISARPIQPSQVGTGLPYDSKTITLKKHPQTNSHGKYMNLKPFTMVKADLGIFGTLELDTTQIYDMDKLYLEYYVDAFSGIGTCYGWAQETNSDLLNRELFKRQVQFGINIPLSMNDSNAIPSIVESAVKLGVGMVDFGSIGDVLSSIQGSIDTMSSSGSILDHLYRIGLYYSFKNQCDIDALNGGYPLNENVTLNTLNGFIKCSNGDIDLNCTDTEKEKIKQFLVNGFYYE